MNKDGAEPYDPNHDVNPHVNDNEPEPLLFSTPPVPPSPPPIWHAPADLDYPSFYPQPIDKGNRSGRNNNSNGVNHADGHNNNNAAQVLDQCNGDNRNNSVIRGDDIIVGATGRNDVLDIIDVSDDSNHIESNNNVVENEEEVVTSEMVSEPRGDLSNVEENVDGKDKGKATITAAKEADVNITNNVMAGDGMGDEAGSSGTGRIMFHWVPFGSLDCYNCTLSTGLYSTDDPRFQARISIHGLNGLCHHMVFEIQFVDPVFAQEVEMFIFDMHGLSLEKINEDLAFYKIQISQNGAIELQETFLNVYDRICGRELLPPPNTDFMRVGGEGNGSDQPTTYDLEAPTPLAIETYTAPRPSMLEAPLPVHNIHYQPHHHHQHHHHHHHHQQQQQQQHLCNHNAMPCYPYALPRGLPVYLPLGLPVHSPPPNQFAAGPSSVNRMYSPPPPPNPFAAGPSSVNRVYSPPPPNQFVGPSSVNHFIEADPLSSRVNRFMEVDPLSLRGDRAIEVDPLSIRANRSIVADPISSRVDSPIEADPLSSRVDHVEADPLSFLDHEIPEWMRGASSPEPEEDDDDQHSWPTIGCQRERTANMSILDLAPYFHVKAEKASYKLKVCTTTLKIVCRKTGLKRWPYRKIRSIDNKIIGLRRVLKESIDKGDTAAELSARRDIQKQRDRRVELYKSIFRKMREKREEEDDNDEEQQ